MFNQEKKSPNLHKSRNISRPSLLFPRYQQSTPLSFLVFQFYLKLFSTFPYKYSGFFGVKLLTCFCWIMETFSCSRFDKSALRLNIICASNGLPFGKLNSIFFLPILFSGWWTYKSGNIWMTAILNKGFEDGIRSSDKHYAKIRSS